MADNLTIAQPGGTTATVATKDEGGVHFQQMLHRPGRAPTADIAPVAVSVSASGDNTLVAAVSGQTTRVHGLYLVINGDTTIKFRRGATDLTGAMPLRAGAVIWLERRGTPWFVTGTNEAFIINSTAAVTIAGWTEAETSA